MHHVILEHPAVGKTNTFQQNLLFLTSFPPITMENEIYKNKLLFLLTD